MAAPRGVVLLLVVAAPAAAQHGTNDACQHNPRQADLVDDNGGAFAVRLARQGGERVCQGHGDAAEGEGGQNNGRQ